jgi:citrate lyase gamma subunit
MYFLHEVFIFTNSNTRSCYYKVSPTEDHPECLMEFPLERLYELSLSVLRIGSDGSKRYVKFSVKTALQTFVYHKFDQTAYLWDQPEKDKSIMSLAQPFNIKVDDNCDDVSEEDLPPILLDYLVNVICNGNTEHWEHLRAYLANITIKPDEKTGIMLVLYSQEKRLGKSTLHSLLSEIMNESNIAKVDNVKDAVGDRGAYAFISKKLLWFEETKGASDSSSYANCMDRLKTTITDRTMSYRNMYEGAKTCRNHFELIACTNNLIGVAENRMTVLHTSDIHKDDKPYFNKLRSTCFNKEVMSKFVKYLSKYTVKNPMTPIKTALFDTMNDNNIEITEQFVNELNSIDIDYHSGETRKHEKFDYVLLKDIYNSYKTWFETNGFQNNKRLSQIKFGSRVEHYNRKLKIRKIVHDGRVDIRVLTAPVGFFSDSIDELVV